jgi:hypothetical protein
VISNVKEMKTSTTVLAMAIIAAVVSVMGLGTGVGIQNAFAVGDCSGCTFNFGGEHHSHGDCGDSSDCSDEGSGN